MEGVVARGNVENLSRETEGPENRKCKCFVVSKLSV